MNFKIYKYKKLLCNTQMVVGKKKSLAFDIRYEFKQKSKPFDAYDNVQKCTCFIHSQESINEHIRSEQKPYEIKYV